MPVKGVGIDIVEIERFRALKGGRKNSFVVKIFTAEEIRHCFGYKDPCPHLAGLFAIKEAVIKAIPEADLFVSDIEVRHTKKGAPCVWICGKRKHAILVSLSHICTLAVATALRQ